jgi:hypothetical protein
VDKVPGERAGTDFVTGGPHDYRLTMSQGFIIWARGLESTSPKAVAEALGTALTKILGLPASIVPPRRPAG